MKHIIFKSKLGNKISENQTSELGVEIVPFIKCFQTSEAKLAGLVFTYFWAERVSETHEPPRIQCLPSLALRRGAIKLMLK